VAVFTTTRCATDLREICVPQLARIQLIECGRNGQPRAAQVPSVSGRFAQGAFHGLRRRLH
jgi:hypothetical protein